MANQSTKSRETLYDYIERYDLPEPIADSADWYLDEAYYSHLYLLDEAEQVAAGALVMALKENDFPHPASDIVDHWGDIDASPNRRDALSVLRNLEGLDGNKLTETEQDIRNRIANLCANWNFKNERSTIIEEARLLAQAVSRRDPTIFEEYSQSVLAGAFIHLAAIKCHENRYQVETFANNRGVNIESLTDARHAIAERLWFGESPYFQTDVFKPDKHKVFTDDYLPEPEPDTPNVESPTPSALSATESGEAADEIVETDDAETATVTVSGGDSVSKPPSPSITSSADSEGVTAENNSDTSEVEKTSLSDFQQSSSQETSESSAKTDSDIIDPTQPIEEPTESVETTITWDDGSEDTPEETSDADTGDGTPEQKNLVSTEAESGAETTEKVTSKQKKPTCGEPLDDGSTCSRTVGNENEKCWQHPKTEEPPAFNPLSVSDDFEADKTMVNVIGNLGLKIDVADTARIIYALSEDAKKLSLSREELIGASLWVAFERENVTEYGIDALLLTLPYDIGIDTLSESIDALEAFWGEDLDIIAGVGHFSRKFSPSPDQNRFAYDLTTIMRKVHSKNPSVFRENDPQAVIAAIVYAALKEEVGDKSPFNASQVANAVGTPLSKMGIARAKVQSTVSS